MQRINIIITTDEYQEPPSAVVEKFIQDIYVLL